jgi:riboflavin kinase/FMN adenylyltransferase
MDLIASCGIAEVHLQDFDADFAMSDPRVFLDEILAARLGVKLIVVGPDYRFGCDGQGNVGFLQAWAAGLGIEVRIVPQVNMADGKISSSRIRSLIQAGELVLAASLLSRPYRISGTVISGRGLGHRLGFPTANQKVPPGKVCPAYGVYATRARVGTRVYEAVTSIGLRPTVNDTDTEPLVETFLYDAGDMPLYGIHISVDFLEMIRPEVKFESLLQLGSQIRTDLEQVRTWHRDHEQCHERDVVHDIPIYVLISDRFAQAGMHLVFHVRASAKRTAENALLMRILTASCRRYPTRISLASALDNLYGSSLDSHVEKNGDLQTLYLSAEGLMQWTDGTSPFQETAALLFDLLFDPLLADDGLFDPETVETERRNLLMELAARENDRGKYAYDRCLALYCGDDPAGIPQYGTSEDIRSITRADLAACWQDLINRSNLSVYLGGRIDEPVIELCRGQLSRFPDVVRPVLFPGLQPAPFSPARQATVTEHKAVEQARIVIALKGMPPYFCHRNIIASVLNSMLGGDVHSLLFDVVREKMGLAYQVYSINQRFLSAIMIIAGVASQSVEQALAAIKDQLAALAAGRFDDQLLERTCSLLEASILSQSDELSTLLAVQIAGRLTGRQLSGRDTIALMHDVTREQLMELAAGLEWVTTYVLAAEQPEKELNG